MWQIDPARQEAREDKGEVNGQTALRWPRAQDRLLPFESRGTCDEQDPAGQAQEGQDTEDQEQTYLECAEAPATENESTQAPATKAIDRTTKAEATPQREEAMCPCPSHQQVATTIL